MTNAEGWKKELQIRGTSWDIKRSSIQFERNISQRFSMFDNAYLVAELCWGRWFQLHEVSIPLARGLKFNSWQRIVLWPCPMKQPIFIFFFQVWMADVFSGPRRWSSKCHGHPDFKDWLLHRHDLRTHNYTWIDAMNGESKNKESIIFPRCELGSTVLSCFRWVFL